MMTPTFSILLPVYNGERYLAKSIESVLAQTHGDFELVAWDDASSDRSLEILASYKDPRIKLHRNDCNQGLFATLNNASDAAQNQWLRLWSQDDEMKPQCLKTECAFIRENEGAGMGMYVCTGDVIDESGKVTLRYSDRPYDPTPKLVDAALAATIMIYHGPLGGNISFMSIRKSALKDCGGFREDMICSGDMEITTRLSRRYLIGFIREALINLRWHPGQFGKNRRIFTAGWGEEKAIVDELVERLPLQEREYARKFYRRRHAPRRIRYLLGRLLKGDIKNLNEAYQHLRRNYSFTNDFLTWLMTLDGHVLQVEPKFKKGVKSSPENINIGTDAHLL